MNLLSIGADAKTVKGEKLGIRTLILYLSPRVRGVCPDAGVCKGLCLETSGRMGMANAERARARRTREFQANRSEFVDRLRAEIEREARRETKRARRSHRRARRLAVRLNGTSDIPLESARGTDGRTLHEVFPRVSFYDYSKSPSRMFAFLHGELPSNYHLTFSRGGLADHVIPEVLARGGNVSVPFATKRGAPLPSEWNGARVIDGDVSDWRPGDPRGVVVGLRAKGRARRASAVRSGFVVGV